MGEAFYNEWDGFAAQWLENLTAAGHLPAGTVSRQSINDLTPGDVTGAHEVHLFAGIGGWPLALRMVGWPATRPVWTGSCPCQPFSNAGKRRGADDERHLWPEMLRLVAECRPPTIFGEQVASRDGREWLAGVRADLEALGYAVGAADLCAAGVGAPHIRQRLFWVADTHNAGPQGRGFLPECGDERPVGAAGMGGGLADADEHGRDAGGVAAAPARYGHSVGAESWDGLWHHCLDGKYRRIPAEPELFPLAHGLPGRVGQLRAYGNAIYPKVAARFVRAFLESGH